MGDPSKRSQSGVSAGFRRNTPWGGGRGGGRAAGGRGRQGAGGPGSRWREQEPALALGLCANPT
eukprot:8724294-Lingulodinium_polyedra.AAC.1